MNKKLLGASMLMATLALSACGGGDDSPAPAPTPSPSPVSAATALAVDTQFGHQGHVQVSLAPHGGALTRVIELPDGKLLLLGHRKLEPALVTVEGALFNPTRQRPNTHLFARRLLANGQVDLSFGNQGVVEWQVAGADEIEDALALPDGSVMLTALGSKSCYLVPNPYGCVVALPGSAPETRSPRLQHLLADGSIDRSGDANGFVQLAGWRTRLAKANDQVLVLSTTSYPRGQLYSWVLSRHAFNTQPDAAFGNNGQLRSRCDTDGAAVQVDASGSIWVAGARTSTRYTQPDASLGLCMERLNADGSVHASMPQPLTVPFGLNLGEVALQVQADQRVLVAGAASGDNQALNYAVSIGPNGQLTGSYGQQGVARFNVPAENTTSWYYSANARIAGTGEVLHTGATHWSDPTDTSQQHLLSTRFTPQGQLDTSWGQAGTLREPLPGTLMQVDAQKRWLVTASDAAPEDQPSVVTLTRLRGGF